MYNNLFNHIDIPRENIHTPDGSIEQERVWEHCRNYEQSIKAQGGIDIMLLGVGRMGTIASNEPGSVITSASRIILTGQTTRDEMTLSFGNNEKVPPCSITMGVATILEARKVFLAAWGDEKAEVIQKTVEEKMTDSVPASFLQAHRDAHVVIDLSAASRLTRIVHPWLVTSCTWTDKLVRSALVWLCETTGKPLLKLTNKDYNANGLSELLALYGSATMPTSRFSTTCNTRLRDGREESQTLMTRAVRSEQPPTPSACWCSRLIPTTM